MKAYKELRGYEQEWVDQLPEIMEEVFQFMEENKSQRTDKHNFNKAWKDIIIPFTLGEDGDYSEETYYDFEELFWNWLGENNYLLESKLIDKKNAKVYNI